MKKKLILLLLLASCTSPSDESTSFDWQQISGRDEKHMEKSVRRPLYRARVPSDWVRLDAEDSILDTMKPNATFLVDGTIRLTIHNFPADSLDQRIPPQAQVERWKRQVQKILSISPICKGGFHGFYFEGEKEDNIFLAWSLQLDLEHFQTLFFLANSPQEKEHFKQMGADYTIKAVGPRESIEKNRESIYLFAQSFELLQGIPERI